MIEWSEQRTAFCNSSGHCLVLGEPGCGKTTMALLKADREVRGGSLKVGQRILFLSFARATISRIQQHAEKLLCSGNNRDLDINTYHGFTWGILRSHGYLITHGRPIRLLPPPQAASRLAAIEGSGAKEAEKRRLFEEDGLLHFDLFASCAAELLRRSGSIRQLVCSMYPIIILDEFQDTNADEWELIQQLGRHSRLIALADPEQRIYEFRGASPTRIPEYLEAFKPQEFDFSGANHRSAGTDICTYGNDLLKGLNKGKLYNQVRIDRYRYRKGNAHLSVKTVTLGRIKELAAAGKRDWSLAILVPTRQLMLEVSQYLDSEQVFAQGGKMPCISHDVAIETAGPALAAAVIADLLEAAKSKADIARNLLVGLCEHIKGRRGSDGPSQQQLELAEVLGNFLKSGSIRGSKRKALVQDCLAIAEARLQSKLSGSPEQDWLMVRSLFDQASTEELKRISLDGRYLKFLHKRTILRGRLAELWRTRGTYAGAGQAVVDALVQEHFTASVQELRGVHVMTIHKSKGKEFSEVIIYEGTYQGRILRANSTDRDIGQALLSLRVGVTRAMRHVTILTPERDPCRFL